MNLNIPSGFTIEQFKKRAERNEKKASLKAAKKAKLEAKLAAKKIKTGN